MVTRRRPKPNTRRAKARKSRPARHFLMEVDGKVRLDDVVSEAGARGHLRGMAIHSPESPCRAVPVQLLGCDLFVLEHHNHRDNTVELLRVHGSDQPRIYDAASTAAYIESFNGRCDFAEVIPLRIHALIVERGDA